jgi:diguanylate cyclase (GGDEF)-like protein
MSRSTSSAERPRVLVVDDEPVNALIVAHALKEEFDVVQVNGGAQALARVAAGDIDLVILDVMMPDIDGFEVCRRLKAEPATAGVPVIFVTSLEDSADETLGFEVGAVDYITKPIRPGIVRARVRMHLELKRSRDLLERLASVDPLTGVANRRRFDAALEDEWRRSQRAKTWLSLAFVDVDHFKQFNDRHGHLAGDDRLRAVAASLSRTARRVGDLVARYGGEEFAVILTGVDPDMMRGMVQNLLRNVAASSAGRGDPADADCSTVSIGAISVIPPRDAAARSALSAADDLLYEAKDGGRDRAVHVEITTGHKVVVTREPGV